MTAVGFEPTPLRTGAWSQRLRPLGQTVLRQAFAQVGGRRALCRRVLGDGEAGAQRAQHMVPRGLEPRTLRLLAVRSNQLSYETFALVAACLVGLLLRFVTHCAVGGAHSDGQAAVQFGSNRKRFATARLAQPAERKALNLVVVGSSPTVGVYALLFGDALRQAALLQTRSQGGSNSRP